MAGRRAAVRTQSLATGSTSATDRRQTRRHVYGARRRPLPDALASRRGHPLSAGTCVLMLLQRVQLWFVSMHTTHGRVLQRSACVGATVLATVLLLMAPTASSAQTTAAPDGWGYGIDVQLTHFDP